MESGLTEANVALLSEQWRAPIDAIVTEPVVSGGRVYTTTRKYGSDGLTLDVLGVQAYDRATGELEWEQSLIPLEGPDVTGDVATPALEDGALWVPCWHEGWGRAGASWGSAPPRGSDAGTRRPVGPRHGRGHQQRPDRPPPSDLVVAGSAVAYMSATCAGGPQLVVRDQETRAVLWTHQFPDGRGVATPTIAGDRLFVLVGETLYAFDADGCGAGACDPLWTEPVDAGFLGFQRLVAGPGGSLVTIAASSDPEAGDTVVVRDAATGDVRWEAEPRYTGTLPGATTGIAVAYGTVYVAGAMTPESGFGNEAILDAYPVDGCAQPVSSPTWTVELGPTRPAHAATITAQQPGLI